MDNITHLRRANPSDLASVLELFTTTIEKVCSKDYSAEQIKVWQASADNHERWLAKITRDEFWVAETGKFISGFASLKNNSYIDLMYVHNDFLHQGIATRLLKKMTDLASQRLIRKITSDVSITAKPFFEKHGFKIIKENHLVLRGVAIMNFQMEFDITGEF